MTLNDAVDLIKLVKENPVIYENFTGGKTSESSLARNQAWSIIGEQLNLPDGVCKSKWVNMRDAFRRHIKLKLGVTKTSRNTPYRNKYKYEDEMSFLLPHLNLPAEYADELRSEEVTHIFVNENSNSELESLEDVAEEEVVQIKKENIFKDVDDIIIEPVSRRKKRHSFMDDDEYVEVKEEGIKMFLHSIGATLNNLNPYFLNKAKSDIFQVVQKYELQQIVERQEHSSSSYNKINKKTKKF